MARRYYGGLNSAGGFADGFSSGFGLINEAVDARKRRELDAEKLAAEERAAVATADYRRAELESRREDRRAAAEREQSAQEWRQGTDKFRRQEAAKTAEWQRGTDKWRREEKKDTEAYRRKREEREDELKRLKEKSLKSGNDANTARLQVETKRLEALQRKETRELEEAQKTERNQTAMTSLNTLDRVLTESKRTGQAVDYDFVNQLMADTKDTPFDLEVLLGADYGSGIANLTSELRKQMVSGNFDFNKPELKSGLDAIVNSYGGGLQGQIIDDSFVNAPKAMQSGKWRILSREARDMRVDVDQNGGGLFSSDVLVTATNIENGDIAHYIAPLTSKRNQGSNVRAQIPVKDLLDGIAGTTVLADKMLTDVKSTAKEARIQKDFGGYSGFDTAVNKKLDEWNREITSEGGGEKRNISPPKKNSDLTPMELRTLAEDRVLGLGSKTESFRAEADRTLIIAKTTVELDANTYKALDSSGNLYTPKLTDAQLFKLAATLKGTEKGATMTAETEELLKEMMEGYGATQKSRPNRKGAGGLQPSDFGLQGFGLPASSI